MSKPLHALALGCLSALPLALLTTRGGSEVLIALIDAGWLLHRLRAPSPIRPTPILVATGAWWLWTVLVSALRLPSDGPHALVQAVVMGRFFILAAALADWLLVSPRARATLAFLVTAAAVWIGVECWQQMLVGTDIFGWPRWGDGALTGPFKGPKAGPALVLILFPAMLPPVTALIRRRGLAPKLAAVLLASVAVATMVLIGQRMPALLTLLGLVACAILLRPVRPVVLATAAAGIALVAATPLISPPTFDKLVVHFTDQMSHFAASPYGLLYTRAAVITLAHPWLGLGFDGFRHACDARQYAHSLPWIGTTDSVAASPIGCSIHPHNHYLEAATAGGFPGLLLFALAVLTWLATLLRGHPTATRAALFTAALIGLWPFASTSAFFTLPNAGWTFLLLGWGLAESRTAVR